MKKFYCDFYTANFEFRLDAEFDGLVVTIPTITRRINHFPGYNSDEPAMRINLGWVLMSDRMAFEEQNKAEDERHQVDLESLEVRGICIEDGYRARVRVDYVFQYGTGENRSGRCCYGELTDLGERMDHDMTESYGKRDWPIHKGEFAPIPVYTKGPHVTW